METPMRNHLEPTGKEGVPMFNNFRDMNFAERKSYRDQKFMVKGKGVRGKVFPLYASSLTPFTLIELLVVIAIIAVLAGMLLPALGTVKEKGRSIACMNLMKQYAVATAKYATGWNDYMPDVRTYLKPESDFTSGFGVGKDAMPPEEFVRCPGDTATEEMDRLGHCDQLGGDLKVSIGASGCNLSDSASPTSKGTSAFFIRSGGPLMIRPSDRVTWTDYQNQNSGTKISGACYQPGAGTNKTSTTLGNNVFRHPGNSSNAAFLDAHAGPIRLIASIETINDGHDLAEGHSWQPPLNQAFPYGPRPGNTSTDPEASGRSIYVGNCPDNPTVIYK